LGNVNSKTVCGLGEKMEWKSVVLAIVGCCIVFPLFWYTIGEPQSIVDDVKSKLTIVEPYDVYESCYALRIDHGWWTVGISTMDIDYGTKMYDLVRYNSNTKVIIPYGKLIGVKICG